VIKHRFIVRGVDDFRIFAAIPSETRVAANDEEVAALEPSRAAP
jgi:hypothetical protein